MAQAGSSFEAQNGCRKADSKKSRPPPPEKAVKTVFSVSGDRIQQDRIRPIPFKGNVFQLSARPFRFPSRPTKTGVFEACPENLSGESAPHYLVQVLVRELAPMRQKHRTWRLCPVPARDCVGAWKGLEERSEEANESSVGVRIGNDRRASRGLLRVPDTPPGGLVHGRGRGPAPTPQSGVRRAGRLSVFVCVPQKSAAPW